ncbi:unnamed protein product [Paramecium octaurelia]|uniref:Uncharacterized protein n=1 Tax=Paramecium octaurelia TaxID=43137 RepID=A0A8S1WX15_PAROT|nr:unnamed protein product [Paramecium octaurelia]
MCFKQFQASKKVQIQIVTTYWEISQCMTCDKMKPFVCIEEMKVIYLVIHSEVRY